MCEIREAREVLGEGGGVGDDWTLEGGTLLKMLWGLALVVWNQGAWMDWTW